MYNIDIQEKVQSACVLYEVRRGNYLRGELIRRAEVEVSMGKLRMERIGSQERY